MRYTLLIFTLCLLIPGSAAGQIDFSQVLSGVTDVGIGRLCWGDVPAIELDDGTCTLSDAFFEVTYEITSGVRYVPKRQVQSVDTVYYVTQIEVAPNGSDTTWTRQVRYDTAWVDTREYRFTPEVALGYSQYGSLISQNPGQFRYTGAVRELPYLAARARIQIPECTCLEVTLGVRTGLTRLHNFRARSTNFAKVPDPAPDAAPSDSVTAASGFQTVWGANSETLTLGAELGLRLTWGVLELSLAGTYQRRAFHGLEWTGQTEKRQPDGLPSSLDLSGLGSYIGVRFHVGQGG